MTELDESEAFAPVTSLRARVIAAGGTASLIAAILAVFFARIITGPVRRLAAETREIGRGNLDLQVGTKGRDEIAELSRALERMTTDLKATTASSDELEAGVAERRRAEAQVAREAHER